MASGPTSELRQLKRFKREAERQFLTPHLSPASIAPPSRPEELAVAAFVVLLHGAVENFAEGLCLWVTSRVEEAWVSASPRVSKATAAVLLSTEVASSDVPSTLFDRIRLALSQAQSVASTRAEKNHGIAQKDLRALLEPVGISLPNDPARLASLDLLVSIRHQWAHQYRFGAKKLKSALDIVGVADDCVYIAEELARSARALRC
jgi:hypothetical protein